MGKEGEGALKLAFVLNELYFWTRQNPTEIICICLSAQCGVMCYLNRMFEWIETFKNSWTSVTSAECSGCLFTSTSDDKQEQAKAMILDDRRATVRDIATQLGIS
jgi:hypothetical protein